MLRGIATTSTSLIIAMANFASLSLAASPTTLTNCQTISSPGNYELSSNVSASGDCFTITVSNVSIDLKGHSLMGDGTGIGITDGANPDTNLVIINGTISNFQVAIDLRSSGSSNATVNHIIAMNNTSSGILLAASNNTVSNSTVNNNGPNGGIVVDGCCNTIVNVQADNNSNEGITSFGGDTLVSNAVAQHNGATGIDLHGSNNTLDNSNSSNNLIGAAIGDHSVVRESIFNKNGSLTGGFGLLVGGCCNSIDNTVASSNQGDGIRGFQCCNLVTNSKVNKNTTNGIDLLAANGTVFAVNANNNLVGVAVTCPSNIVRLNARHNSGGNLVLDTSGGACTETKNNAP
jgi:hypothetical protein